jgi:ribosome maturation factor RimP
VESEVVVEGIRPTCEAVLHRRGLDLVALTLGREAGGRVLRVLVERLDGSLTLGEIASVSEEISRALDLEDPIEGAYTLEVSSPGIERPLLRPSDYARFEGHPARVRTTDPIEGRRNFKGVIQRSGDETFVLELEDVGVVEIPFVSVAKAKLVADWTKELKGGP